MVMIKGHHFPGGKSVMPKVRNAPPPKNGGEAIEIKAIDNGYLIEKRTWSEGKRGYKSSTKTVFSPTKPKLDV